MTNLQGNEFLNSPIKNQKSRMISLCILNPIGFYFGQFQNAECCWFGIEKTKKKSIEF